MNAIKNKIKSEAGASITFALLIFLVCAILSGVIVVAGSTAAGRMSQIAQSDQRYYAVTSAAGVLRDSIDRKRVTVTYEVPEKEDGDTEEAAIAPEAVKIEDVTDPDHLAAETLTDYPIIVEASKRLIEKVADPAQDTGAADTSFQLTKEAAAAAPGESEDESGAQVTDYSFLTCDIKEFVRPEGQLVFEISNVPTQKNKAVYTLQVIFTSTVSQSSTAVNTLDASGNAGQKTVVTSTVEWRFSGIRKGAVAVGNKSEG